MCTGKGGIIMLPLTIALVVLSDPINGDFFEKIYSDHSKRAYAIAYNIVKNHQDAEDVVQDTYLKLYRSIEKIRNLECGEIEPFITICIKNAAIDYIRKRGQQIYRNEYLFEDWEQELEDFSSLPDEIAINHERIEKLNKCIDLLPEKQRHVILLRFKYGMSEIETANILFMTESAVSSCVDRAKKTLYKKMGENY